MTQLTLPKAIVLLEERLKESPVAYNLARYKFRKQFPKLYNQFEESMYYESFKEIAEGVK